MARHGAPRLANLQKYSGGRAAAQSLAALQAEQIDGSLNLETAVDRSHPLEVWRPTTACAHGGPHPAGETATHPIEPPSATLAALRISRWHTPSLRFAPCQRGR
jgi:hypothetical protein